MRSVVLFGAAIAVIALAITGPIEVWARYALWVHMVQHVLLTFVAAPLIVASAPVLLLWRGVPKSWRSFLQPFVVHRRVRAVAAFILHPWTALVVYTLGTWLWHAPRLYQLAESDGTWHAVEHATFLFGAILLWIQIIEPIPLRSAWSPLARVGLVLAADVQNTAFCGLLAFAGRPLYDAYQASAIATGLDPLLDQERAAGIMWIASQVMLLSAAAWLVRKAFTRNKRRFAMPLPRPFPRRIVRPLLSIIAAPRVRTPLRWIVAVVAFVIILDGFFGPQEASANLAGTWPWSHGRGLIVIAIILFGNVACVACPFMAPRGFIRRFIRPRRAWPAALRSYWLVIGLLVGWFVLYESCDVWSSPFATSIVLIAYFVLLLIVDSTFSGTSFCTWVCPLGAYNRTVALASVPMQPITISAPSRTRFDRGVVYGVLVCGAFVGAAAMTEPVSWALSAAAEGLRFHSDVWLVAIAIILTTLGAALGIGFLASNGDRGQFTLGWRGLVPLGAAMWCSHFAFHLVTGWTSGFLAIERVAGDLHLCSSTEPNWSLAAMNHAWMPWLIIGELIALQVGAIASISFLVSHLGRAGWKWIMVAVLLTLIGFWIVCVPMEMRGMGGMPS